MSTTLQVIIAVSLVIIAVYFILLTVLSVIAYLKVRAFQRYMEKILREKLEIAFEHLQNITASLEDLSISTTRKVEDLTGVIPEIRDKIQELIDLLDLVQEKIRSPLFNLVSALKIFSQKVNRWL